MKANEWALSVAMTSVSLAIYPSVAQAHSPIKGIGVFYGHMLHPLSVPGHALLLIAAALMLGQQSRLAARIGLAALWLGFAAGLTISGVGLVGGVQERLLLAGALMMGAAVILNRKLPLSVMVPALTAVGLAIGLDSAPDGTNDREMMLAFVGLVFGFVGVATIITGLTIGLTKEWQQIGVRVAGSWIVAVAILVLALSLASNSSRQATMRSLTQGHPSAC